MADSQVSSRPIRAGDDSTSAFPGNSVQNLAFRLENRWRAASEYLSDYIDLSQKNQFRYHNNPPATEETILVTTNNPPINYEIAAARDLLQRELVFCKEMLSTAENIFRGPHIGRMIITTILLCVKCFETVAIPRTWNSRISKAGSVILWSLVATSFFITALGPFGEWRVRLCRNSISKVQELLRTRALEEKHRSLLTNTAWTTTFRLLTIEAMISRRRRHLQGIF